MFIMMVKVLQKYSRRIFFNIGIIRKLTNFTGKHLCRDVFLISFKKKLQYRCFPVRFVNFLKIYNFSQNTSGGCVILATNTCAFVASFYLRLLTQDKLFVRKVYVMETLTKKKKKQTNGTLSQKFGIKHYFSISVLNHSRCFHMFFYTYYE